MNILILGSGGREHAFAWKLHQSPRCQNLFVAPGNAGTSEIAVNVELDIFDFVQVMDFIKENEIHLLLVGPEGPLVAGISDFFEENLPGLMVVGPKKIGAQMEGSKAFAKDFMIENQIPTATYFEVTENNVNLGIKYLEDEAGPYVLKADGLAAGKGVLILEERQEAIKCLKEMLEGKFGVASQRVVIEKFLKGKEFSVFILTDGQYYTMLPVAKDYKRIGEGDTGLNTGGMGAVSPVSFVSEGLLQKVKERIILPTLSGMVKRNIDYLGFLFFGLIEVEGEPYVIEYNCRMGDPETQVVLPRLQNDLVELFLALFEEDLYEIPLRIDTRVATTVVLVSGGYPGKYESGMHIDNLSQVSESISFHAGTTKSRSQILTNGGRVIALTSLARTKEDALKISLKNAKMIQFQGKYFRKDIGRDL